MSGTVTEVILPDGTHVWARVTEEEPPPVAGRPGPSAVPGAPPPGGGYSDTGLGGRTAARLEGLRELVTGVAGSLAEGLRTVRPDEVKVTFGVEFTARAGKVVGLLADGEGKTAVTVTLTWKGTPPGAPGQAG
ncbi:hypothetical protein GCM10009716_08660 [Streptomyces sodiiphilus]|uniref:Trypsin-co-occurring domain-containing protein n=1 Tax=Streptomyces sodiiphilus TaxID=226217 RepID=A0ABP5A3L3_9ACTN